MLRKYFEEFMADVPEQLPQLIHKSWMKKPIIYDEYILLEFNFAVVPTQPRRLVTCIR